MSNKDRVFAISQNGGLLNPDGHFKCGAKDGNARHLEPIHWGGCKGCHDFIVEVLKARYPAPPKSAPIKQESFPFIEESTHDKE